MAEHLLSELKSVMDLINFYMLHKDTHKLSNVHLLDYPLFFAHLKTEVFHKLGPSASWCPLQSGLCDIVKSWWC